MVHVYNRLLKVKVLVAQSCSTLPPRLCSPLGSSVHGILQARILGGLPFHSPGNSPNPGIGHRFPALQVGSLLSEPPGNSAIKKKNKVMPFAAMWMDPEITILSELSQKEKDKYYIISHICGI